jgi:hypothetical protein
LSELLISAPECGKTMVVNKKKHAAELVGGVLDMFPMLSIVH